MKSLTRMTLGLASALLASTAVSNVAQAEDLTLCWAAWDPANALVELSKDFTAQIRTFDGATARSSIC